MVTGSIFQVMTIKHEGENRKVRTTRYILDRSAALRWGEGP